MLNIFIPYRNSKYNSFIIEYLSLFSVPIRKSVGAERTFGEDLATLPEQQAALKPIAAEVARRMAPTAAKPSP